MSLPDYYVLKNNFKKGPTQLFRPPHQSAKPADPPQKRKLKRTFLRKGDSRKGWRMRESEQI